MTTQVSAGKGKRRLIALFSALLLLLAVFLQGAPARVSADSRSELEDQIKDLEDKEKDLKNQIAQAESNLDASKDKQELLQKQVDNVRQQITLYTDKLDTLNAQLSEKNSEIAKKEGAVAEQEVSIADAKEKLEERMRAVAKKGNVSTMQMLLSTEDYADYLIKSKMMERIAENDQKALDALETELAQINAEKAQLETDKQGIDAQKSEIQALKTKSDNKKKELDNLYAQIQAEVKKNQSSVNSYSNQLKSTEEQIAALEKQIDQIINGTESTGKYGGGTMFWPVPTVRNISSGFGYRWGRLHRGVDIANGSIPIYGENIVAAADGVVIYANYTNSWGGGYGYYCIVDHGLDSQGRKVSTLYAHTSKMLARVGDKVVGGQTVLAQAGDTGDVTGPHLHFEVRLDGTAVDPIKNGYLKMN